MTKFNSIIEKLRKYLLSYAHFADKEIVKPLALWIAATYIFEAFDCFPYLAITAKTKRAGKTRLAELISFTCSTPITSIPSAAALRRAIKDMKPTLISDEMEKLSSETASTMRQLLNVGYRKGQTMMVADGKYGFVQWPTFCPKVFILIGNVYDTLRDRSIEIVMERLPEGEKLKDFMYETAKAEGGEIAEELKALCAENLEKIQAEYNKAADINFLTDRDAEIWRPIFAMQRALNEQTITRVAVDLATEKTLPSFTISKEEQKDRELRAERESYARRVLGDMLIITKNRKSISSADAIKALHALDTAPWRVYAVRDNLDSKDAQATTANLILNGTGLDVRGLATLLQVFGLVPKPIRNAVTDNSKQGKKYSGQGQNVARGYARKDIELAAKKAGVN